MRRTGWMSTFENPDIESPTRPLSIISFSILNRSDRKKSGRLNSRYKAAKQVMPNVIPANQSSRVTTGPFSNPVWLATSSAERIKAKSHWNGASAVFLAPAADERDSAANTWSITGRSYPVSARFGEREHRCPVARERLRALPACEFSRPRRAGKRHDHGQDGAARQRSPTQAARPVDALKQGRLRVLKAAGGEIRLEGLLSPVVGRQARRAACRLSRADAATPRSPCRK